MPIRKYTSTQYSLSCHSIVGRRYFCCCCCCSLLEYMRRCQKTHLQMHGIRTFCYVDACVRACAKKPKKERHNDRRKMAITTTTTNGLGKAKGATCAHFDTCVVVHDVECDEPNVSMVPFYFLKIRCGVEATINIPYTCVRAHGIYFERIFLARDKRQNASCVVVLTGLE